MNEEKLNQLFASLIERDEKIYNLLIKMDQKIDKLDERVGKLEERVGKLEERVGKLEERVDKLEQKINDVKEELEQKINDVKKELKEEIDRKIKEAKKEIAEDVSELMLKDIIPEFATKKEFNELKESFIVVDKHVFPEKYIVNEESEEYTYDENESDTEEQK